MREDNEEYRLFSQSMTPSTAVDYERRGYFHFDKCSKYDNKILSMMRANAANNEDYHHHYDVNGAQLAQQREGITI